MRKIAHHKITATIHCLSGLRIGGSDEQLQIGGADLTCIKHPVTLQPYIPGTSLKGKMRSELEKQLGRVGGKDGTEPCGCGRLDCLVCRVFGPHKNVKHQLGPTRIIVRDAQLSAGAGGDLEYKAENVINRATGTAEHPRRLERVAAGARFGLKIGVQVWDFDEDRDSNNQPCVSYKNQPGAQALIEFVLDGLRAICDTGLGAGVSKGSGEITLEDLQIDGQARSL
jgi:CRISPR-associated protein Csm3